MLRSLLTLCAAVSITAALFSADEKKEPAPPPATAPAESKSEPKSDLKTEGPVVVMPKLEVTASRLREIDVTIKKLEKQISREKKKLEKSQLDEALNSEKITRAAAILGGKSTTQRASVSAVRIESMSKELGLLETLRTPLTREDRALIEQLIEDQRKYRRELDEALR